MKERVDFVGHKIINLKEPDAVFKVNNIILPALSDRQEWINKTTENIGKWRAIFRSIYIKWALCINSIDKAIERYSDDEFKKNGKFWIDSYRVKDGSTIGLTKIALWGGEEVADKYQSILPLMAESAIIEMYSAIEEYVFENYKIFLDNNPFPLLKGPENKELKKLYKAKKINQKLEGQWNNEWKKRLNNWNRKKAYDGIKKVFNSYSQVSKLTMGGKGEELSGVAESLNIVSLLRNLLVHNEPYVTDELAELASKNYCPFPNIFTKGEKLSPDLSTLMGIENMCDSMLTVINFSCIGLVKKLIY